MQFIKNGKDNPWYQYHMWKLRNKEAKKVGLNRALEDVTERIENLDKKIAEIEAKEEMTEMDKRVLASWKNIRWHYIDQKAELASKIGRK